MGNTTLNYELKIVLKHLRDQGRLAVLIDFITSTNRRGRCWKTVDRIAADTGWGKNSVVDAIDWLRKSGALEFVPYKLRIGEEKDGGPNGKVYEITGEITIEGQTYQYLYKNEFPERAKTTPDATGGGLSVETGEAGKSTPDAPETTLRTNSLLGNILLVKSLPNKILLGKLKVYIYNISNYIKDKYLESDQPAPLFKEFMKTKDYDPLAEPAALDFLTPGEGWDIEWIEWDEAGYRARLEIMTRVLLGVCGLRYAGGKQKGGRISAQLLKQGFTPRDLLTFKQVWYTRSYPGGAEDGKAPTPDTVFKYIGGDGWTAAQVEPSKYKTLN